MPKTVALLGTFDTKAKEFGFVADELRRLGVRPYLINVGTKPAGLEADVTTEEIVAFAGETMETLRAAGSRMEALAIMIRGAQVCVKKLADEGVIDGIMSMGGSGGTTLGCDAMRILPFGFPKLMVSTLGGSARIVNYTKGADIILMNSVADVAGLNSITTRVFREAAGVIAGAVAAAEKELLKEKPRIAASMYGLTTKGVTRAISYLEEKGYEVLVFHANGAGGRTMEQLISTGYFDGVLDMTTTEVGAHVLGSAAGTAGPERCGNAPKMGIPAVVCPGAMDMVFTTEFGGYEGHKIYCHNDVPSHIRPNREDVRKIGAFLSKQLNTANGNVAVIIPHGGLSGIDVPGGYMYDRETDEELFAAIREGLDPDIPVIDRDEDINNEAFALLCGETLHEMILRGRKTE